MTLESVFHDVFCLDASGNCFAKVPCANALRRCFRSKGVSKVHQEDALWRRLCRLLHKGALQNISKSAFGEDSFKRVTQSYCAKTLRTKMCLESTSHRYVVAKSLCEGVPQRHKFKKFRKTPCKFASGMSCAKLTAHRQRVRKSFNKVVAERHFKKAFHEDFLTICFVKVQFDDATHLSYNFCLEMFIVLEQMHFIQTTAL